jgi:hypothetical protein
MMSHFRAISASEIQAVLSTSSRLPQTNLNPLVASCADGRIAADGGEVAAAMWATPQTH